ncbi:hypothetical protein HPB52_021885 [Rhipicephalus sanguineus]|uniref:Uncharacterized protein n=1 Tax=Rhipicephalus sanguineus TaxID=34632 RepID=A0A9D4SRE4_RHISA|nr:hypothetical protein HPB52_021885 [Rhipicephalus sanguineus]
MPGVGTYISWLRRHFSGSAPSETRGGVGRNISVSASYDRAVGANHCGGLGQRGSERLLNELGAQIYDFKCSPRTAALPS